MEHFWDRVIWNNTIRDWMIALGIVIVSMVLLRWIKQIVVARIKAFAARTTTTIDDFVVTLIGRSLLPLFYLLAIYSGLHYLELPPKPGRVLHILIMVLVTFFIIRGITAFISYSLRKAMGKGDQQRENQARGIMLIIQVAIWILGIIFLVDNLGYDITTLIAGLGIGGIAIALAAQTILGDLFSYLVIFFDKPFEVGDFIIVDDKLGTVEHIGIKTTRIRTLGGEQLVCANTDLTNSRVHNYKRMQQRRIVFSFRIVYGTPVEKLREIPRMVREIVENQDRTRFDRAHFQGFGESWINFEVVYFVLSSDYNVYMDIQQAINLAIVEKFEQSGIRFALPARTITVHT